MKLRHALRTAFIGAALGIGACSAQPAEPTRPTPSTPATPRPTLVAPSDSPMPVATFDPAVAETHVEAGRSLFEYDASLPLNVSSTPEPIPAVHHAEVHELAYDSPVGGRVAALLVLPTGLGPHPAVVMQHGMPGGRRDLLGEALDLGRAGVAAILIDAPHARPDRLGPGTQPVNLTEQDRAEQIQLIVDLRRAVDLLEMRPEIDRERIGYLGVSYGAAMGGLLAGIERRINAYVLAVGDGGLVAHFTGPDDSGGPLDTLPPERREAWLAAMEPIEPIYYVGQATVPVLFQSGERDDVVPPADAAAYHAAANDLATVVWYDAGHLLNRAADCDAAVWLGEHLEFDGNAAAPCS